MGHIVKTAGQVAVMRPRFIYIAGADGTGKSTQARLLLEHLQGRGIRCRHLWLRFPFLLSLSLLVYARWRGYSWHEVTDGVDQGYWDFRQSWLMRQIFPWVVLLDAALVSILKVYLPLWLGYTIVCERYVFDMVVDLSLALRDPIYRVTWSGNCLLKLLPPDSFAVILDLDAATARERRPDLLHDRWLEDRLVFYRDLAQYLSLTVLDSRRLQSDLAELIRGRAIYGGGVI
jgi:thymidylate kinase